MRGVLEGIKVVELATMVAAPSCAGILADWGADVIKVESPAGDPMRIHYQPMSDFSPPFELDNRGKRGLVLDLKRPASQTAIHRLLERADVFITNVRPRAISALGLDYDSLHARYPRLVYCHLTGYGLEGADRDRPSYDVGAYWSRTSLAHMLTAPGYHPPIQRAGVGDHPSGAAAAGGICAALFARERSGEGQQVSVSLVRTGAYSISWDLMVKLHMPGFQDEPFLRAKSLVPISNVYLTKDGRWIWLLMFEVDRHMEPFLKAVGLWERYRDDPTFEAHSEKDIGEGFTLTQYAFDRIERAVRIIDETFAERTLAEWREILDEHDIWYEVVQNREEFLADPVARDAGAVVEDPSTGARTIATPVELDHMDRDNFFRPAPGLGEHTREILDELGLSGEEREAVLREIEQDS
jgi:crotonobetainyl-CoA:carnitine CoA-transferase CaiB-like acyl-CoA transferase